MRRRIRPYINQFLNYADRYSSCGNGEAIRLKRNHSLRVLKEAERITEALNFEPDQAFVVHLSALFHDLGRFEQFLRFGTFNDNRSINHALLSIRILHRISAIDLLPIRRKRLVMKAIYLHNRRSLPKDLNPVESMVCRIVRDADKLDIFRVICTHLAAAEDFESNIMQNLRFEPEQYSQSVYAKVNQRKIVRLEDVRTGNDYILFVASWIYDFNFTYTRKRLKQKGLLERLLCHLPQRQPEIAMLCDQLLTDLDETGITISPLS